MQSVFVPNRSNEIIQQALSPYGITIAIERFGRVGPSGSGFFFAVEENYFLVTAMHVVMDAVNDPNLDVAVYKLSTDELAKLTARRFARLSDCLPIDPPSGSSIVILGVLNECSEAWNASGPIGTPRIVRVALVTRLTETVEIPPAVDRGLQHCCDADWVWDKAVRGGLNVPITIRGMSGCAAWVVPGDPCEEHWTMRNPLICGIQSSVLPQFGESGEERAFCRIIKWGVAFELIRMYFPSVAKIADRLAPVQLVRRA
jgi:hypothetical protein